MQLERWTDEWMNGSLERKKYQEQKFIFFNNNNSPTASRLYMETNIFIYSLVAYITSFSPRNREGERLRFWHEF